MGPPLADVRRALIEHLMLTDAQIGLLRDIGMASKLSEEQKTELSKLVAKGYIERHGDLFKLSATGLRALLTKRK